MATPELISLFREQKDPPRRPLYFLASVLIHGGVIALLFFGIASIPQVETQAAPAPAMIRRIDLKTAVAERQAAKKGTVRYPGTRPADTQSAATTNHSPRSALRLVAKAPPARQALIQPDVADPIKAEEELPVPMVALWTPSQTPVKEIVAPERTQTAADNTAPSLDRPNEGARLADVNLTAAKVDEPNIETPASNTSPVAVDKLEETQEAPQTLTQAEAQPTPASVLSLSDLEMKNGAILLPPVNESAQIEAPGELAAGKARQQDTQGDESVPGGNAMPRADITNETETAPPVSAPVSGLDGEPNGARNGYASGAEQSARLGMQGTSTAIALPPDGRFSAVIVGSSLGDQFPEIAATETSRMAYVVYVHVGLARNWILQYSLSGDEEAAGGGNIVHLDAPWPYSIVRPNLAPDAIAADALMIHGFVNAMGRFEDLRIVFPRAFPQAEFVMSALEQWQFRPAMQNGIAVSVEVLLIIPGDLN